MMRFTYSCRCCCCCNGGTSVWIGIDKRAKANLTLWGFEKTIINNRITMPDGHYLWSVRIPSTTEKFFSAVRTCVRPSIVSIFKLLSHTNRARRSCKLQTIILIKGIETTVSTVALTRTRLRRATCSFFIYPKVLIEAELIIICRFIPSSDGNKSVLSQLFFPFAISKIAE